MTAPNRIQEVNMSVRSYRLVVVGSVLSWFLLGLHFPIVHQMTGHGRAPSVSVIVAVTVIVVASLAGLWVLLRTPPRGES